MKRQSLAVWLLAALLAVAAAISCGRSPGSLRVSGLYLGMTLEDALPAVEELYRRVEGAAFKPVRWSQMDSYTVHSDRPPALDVVLGAREGRVRLIILNPGLVERLYAAKGLSAGQLAQRFAAEHGLPAMEHGVNANPPQPEHYWQYVSRRGWKVVIDEDKDIVLSFWRGTPGEKF
ncbi:MAG: hypothetical protein MUF02_10200 [Acidobacteria bacterium]|jgi:hypothetical protein|nr:hypothetical protein [Acidobacteriota bacterium]